MKTKKLKRFCKECDKKYIPTGRFQKLCEKCQEKRQIEARKKLVESNRKRISKLN